jgi:hypothetical protein
MNFKNMEATEVSQLLIKQLNNLYFINDSEGQSILSVTERVFSRLEYCFNNISNIIVLMKGLCLMDCIHVNTQCSYMRQHIHYIKRIPVTAVYVTEYME